MENLESHKTRRVKIALDSVDKRLVTRAIEVRKRSYAPYSKYRVGCALIDERGRIHSSCNVENSSLSLTVHAEIGAIVRMVAEGGRRIRRLAVVTSGRAPVFPCGICLQGIREFGEDVEILAASASGVSWDRARLSKLYPKSFTKEHIC